MGHITKRRIKREQKIILPSKARTVKCILFVRSCQVPGQWHGLRSETFYFNSGRTPYQTTQIKMICPLIRSRVKEWNDGVGLGIDPGQIRTFEVAVPTGERQIIHLRFSSVLLGDDVLNVKRSAKRILWRVTVFTSGCLRGYECKPRVPSSCRKTCRALDCQYARRSPILTYASSSARSSSVNLPSLAFAFSSSARAASASGKSSATILSASGLVIARPGTSNTFRRISA